MFNGIIFAVMADTGPMTEINLSSLDETSAMKLSISLLTAIGLGESRDQINQLHGSFPVPGRKELALAYPFNLEGDESKDPRIQFSGRYCTIFLLFDKEEKSRVLDNYGNIEKILFESLKSIENQKQISIQYLKDIYTNLESLISYTEGKSAPSSIKESAVSFQEIREAQTRYQVLSAIIRDITQVQTSINSLLDEYMVFTDPPILEGSYYMRPNVKPEEFLKIYPLITRYNKILAQLDGEDKETVKEIVEISVLVRVGNLFYWKALTSQQTMEFEKALEFYMRANHLRDDSILYLTIGSIYRKLGRDEEAKDWIEGGFSRMRKRKESIRISKNMLFGDVK